MLGIISIIFSIFAIICIVMIIMSEDNSTLKTVGMWGMVVCLLIAFGTGLFWWKYRNEESNQSLLEDSEDGESY